MPQQPDVTSTALGTYFREIDAGNFEAVLATLSDSCVYVRPGAQSGAGPAGLETFLGRDAIRSFLDKRGVLPIEHVITSALTDNLQCFVQGTATYTSSAHTEQSIFMAHATLDGDGLISRFLAISTALDATAARWLTARS